MFILSDIGLFLFTSIFMYVIYFLIKNALTFKALSFLHVSKHLVSATSGFLLGLSIVFVKYIDTSIDSNFNVPLFVIAPLVLLSFTNLNTTLYSILVAVIGYLIQNDITLMTYIIVSTFIFIIIIFLLLNFTLKKEAIFISYLIAIIVVTSLSYVIIEFTTNISDLRLKIEAEIMMGPGFILIYIPYMILARISASTDSLFESANFVYDGYIRKSFMKDSVNKYIKERKITKGLYVIFNPFDNMSENNFDYEEVKTTTLKKIKFILGDEVIMFELENNNFGFFREILPTKEDADAIRFSNQIILENEILNPINIPYKTTANRIVNGNLSFAFSIYGIDESSIDMLEDNALYVLKSNRSNNDFSVKYYEFPKVKKQNIDSNDVKKLDEWIGLENFSNNYHKILDYKNNEVGILVNTKKKWEFDVSDNVEDLIRYNMWYSTFERYFATIAIKENINSRLFIDYSTSLDANFNSEIFEKNILKYNKIKEDIVFMIKEEICKNESIKMVSKMRKKGFIFAIKTDTESAISKNFDYIITNKKSFKNVNSKKIIYLNPEKNENDSPPTKDGYSFYVKNI